MSTTPMSLAQFGQTIKAKYPQYNDLADEDVGQKVLAKYPQYQDMVRVESNPIAPSPQGLANRALAANPKSAGIRVGAQTNDLPQPASGVSGTAASSAQQQLDVFKALGKKSRQVAKGVALTALSGPYAPAIQGAISAHAMMTGKQANPDDALDNANASLGIDRPAIEAAARAQDYPTLGAETAAPVLQALLMAKGVGAATDAVVPSVARAGATMNAVKSAAGDIPVNLAEAGNVALRTRELAQAGGSMPKVVRDFLNRASDPTKGPITYAEAQDFYSNATRLSADEFNRLTPTMQRQIAMFTDSLGKSMKGAADQVGMGDQLVQGKAEYSKAMTAQEHMQALKDALVKGAIKSIPYGIGGLLAGSAYKLTR